MKVLVIGQGGREHCLVHALKKSKRITELLCAKGNAGISQIATCVDINTENIEAVARYVRDNGVDYTIVGPEQPLADGIVDLFKKEKLNIFGPEKKAAILESSKVACKNLLKQWNIPTADFHVFSDYQEAKKHLRKASFPLVLKADGLCQGKGVVICKTLAEAEKALTELMRDKVFGAAASSVVIEDFLEGEEVSIIALSDGKNFICFPPSQDHKRVYDNDQGPNTGGMGAYSPVPIADAALLRHVEESIIKRTIQGMYKDVACFKGFLYAGLMITKDKQPYVLEYNVRSGDPETQVILPKLQSDLFELIVSADNGTLSSASVSWDPRVCLCAVLTSGGYPGAYKKGFEIQGLDTPRDNDVFVYHAGTAFDAQGRVVTAGGRVLNIVGLSDTILSAQKKVYKAIQDIHFEGMHYRKDIGLRGTQHK